MRKSFSAETSASASDRDKYGTLDKALNIVAERGCPREISFDHDLGGHDTAMTVVKALVEFDLDAGGRYIPPDFDFVVHSSNPVGARNISGLLQGYLQARDERRN